MANKQLNTDECNSHDLILLVVHYYGREQAVLPNGRQIGRMFVSANVFVILSKRKHVQIAT